MFFQHRTLGFVFKKEDQFEADRAFSVFTKDFGRIEVVGRAIRKIASKLRSGMDIFYFSEIEFIQGKNRKTLTDAIAKEKFSNLLRNHESFSTAVKICKLTDGFIKEQQADGRIFNLLKETFGRLNNPQFLMSNLQLLQFYFFWNLISFLGYKPELYSCAACAQKLEPHNLYFSSKEGGVICGNCSIDRGSLRMSENAVKILRIIIQNKWDVLSVLKAEEIDKNILRTASENYRDYLLFNYFCGTNRKNF